MLEAKLVIRIHKSCVLAGSNVIPVVVGHDPKCSMGRVTDQSRHGISYKSFLRESPRVVINILSQAFAEDFIYFLPR